ncbi:Arginine deiminase [Porphyridium purpureum]|uniref:Arginine deiminase n=1 Tax=Porphyridium purpureum TaxID=35688 RepID=A0A5J4Z9K0_PORPP|nr:Arginine deiminase [Porphyridium purpureum]|eukprot:POR8227..scf295_1
MRVQQIKMGGGTKTGQNHEVDRARVVVIAGPGLGKMMGSMHPAGSLYERPTNINKVEEEMAGFRAVLEQSGVKVYDVREVLRWNTCVGHRVDLEEMAARCLTYELDRTSSYGMATDEKVLHYVGEEYKRHVIEEMSDGQLVNIIMTNPTVTLRESYRDTGFTARYSFDPLSNINFTRDQQITTRKGIVMGRLRSEQRRKEVDVLEFCHRKLGLEVIGRIPEPGFLEGGDFFPVGEHLCLIGVGPRSNLGACEYMMKNDLLGTSKVAVVKDEFELCQDRMHLDTVFNILDTDCCLMLQEMMGENSETRRMVDEYRRDSPDQEYYLARENIEFSQYITEQGFNIIPVSGEDQLKYGCNVLNLGNGLIIAVHKKTAREISRSPFFRGQIKLIEFRAITSMYGAVHCASQVVLRGDDDDDRVAKLPEIKPIARHEIMGGGDFGTRDDDAKPASCRLRVSGGRNTQPHGYAQKVYGRVRIPVSRTHVERDSLALPRVRFEDHQCLRLILYH